ncbi:MAG: ABC transporter substrate-binding protein [Alphaproteobacteria bacterium]|nr:ABC transporter substrate-binding protein [Alphaproteobacteria bacterium]
MFKSVLAAAALILTGAASAQDTSASEAEAFVESNAQSVIETLQALQAGERDLDEVRAEFRDRIDRLADVERITNFVLGRYRRTASEEDLAAFSETFREYAISVYETELTNYAGQTLSVTGSVTRSPGDYVVRSEVTGGPDGRTYDVNWRVLESDGELQVLDAQVFGVWLAQTQREQILSIIGNNRGQVSAATEALNDRLENSGTQAADAPQGSGE